MSELLTNGKISVSVLFDTVQISISCGDDYEAQTLFDEIVARVERGDGVTLGRKDKP